MCAHIVSCSVSRAASPCPALPSPASTRVSVCARPYCWPHYGNSPVDAGFICDKVTVLRKMIKHLHLAGSMYMNFTNLKWQIHWYFCAPFGSTGGYTVLQLCIMVTVVHFVMFARTFFLVKIWTTYCLNKEWTLHFCWHWRSISYSYERSWYVYGAGNSDE
jgi:hypothetical protein